MVDANIIASLVTAGESLLADVRRFRDDTDQERFVADRGEQYRIEFPLQQAIQVAIDLAAHVLADSVGTRPDTLSGMFDALADRGFIGRDLATRLAQMARFLNLLVHRYADIDLVRVWRIVVDHLSDLDEFLAVMAQHALAGGTDEDFGPDDSTAAR